ncbi:MAG: DUF4917 family protein [Gordonia sp. (in: high G+C Gram-positive bacteria)]
MGTHELGSFDEALNDAAARGIEKHVLLGNGFSRAYSGDFSYSTLKDMAMFGGLSVSKESLFEHAGSDDFETVIDNLSETISLLKIYGPEDKLLLNRLRGDRGIVRRGLVETLASIHPDSARGIPDGSYVTARKFLRNFDKIFTLNYDMLLYWALMRDQVDDQVFRCGDGFGWSENGLVWSRPEPDWKQNVYYLHGAMHFYVQDRRLYKLQNKGGSRMITQLLKNLDSGRLPQVVTEGSRKDKERRISGSAYLKHCHRTLTSLAGSLFFFGVALSENDGHVLDRISRADGLKCIYVALYGEDCDEHSEVRATMEKLVRKRKEIEGPHLDVMFYPAQSVDVW